MTTFISTQQTLLWWMKMSLYQCVLAVLFSSVAWATKTAGQDLLDKKISLQIENEPLKSVFADIERIANARFMYSSSLVPTTHTVTVTAKKERLGTVLDRILAPHQLTYQVSGQHILIQRRKGNVTEQVPTETQPPVPAYEVTGTVMGANNEPLIGASVALVGSNKGAVTDVNGQFRLALSDEDKNGTLRIALVGYATQTVALAGRTTLTVVLQEDNALNEVVVIGYGSVKKSDLTGAVSSVKAEQIAAYPAPSLTRTRCWGANSGK